MQAEFASLTDKYNDRHRIPIRFNNHGIKDSRLVATDTIDRCAHQGSASIEAPIFVPAGHRALVILQKRLKHVATHCCIQLVCS